MNKSYSKIRHIQEANQQLEKRLVSEQLLGASGAMAALRGTTAFADEMIDINPEKGAEAARQEPRKCLEYYPARDQVWNLIQKAQKSPAGSANPSNPEVATVRNAIASGNLIQKIPAVFFKLGNTKDFSSFVKSYNLKGNLFSELDKFGNILWPSLTTLIQPDLLEDLGVPYCKKWSAPEVRYDPNDPRA